MLEVASLRPTLFRELNYSSNRHRIPALLKLSLTVELFFNRQGGKDFGLPNDSSSRGSLKD